MKMSLFKKAVLTMACLTLFTIGAHASANAVYIAQNAAGAANGADCADAKPVSFFNTPGNWGSGTAQIGPGTTVYLCGTFTGAAGSTMLTIQGNGAPGNPVIINGTGATLTAPAWNYAIGCSGFSYITLDGGGTGTITSTQNGSALTYQNNGNGMQFTPCSNIEVKNWIISNIYVHTLPSDSNDYGADIYFAPGSDKISVHNNTVTQAAKGIFVLYSNLTSAAIYNNTTDYNKWSIGVLDDNSSSTANGVSIYGNTLGPHYDTWYDTAFALHLDGIMGSAANPGASMTGTLIYNNLIQGDMGASGDPNGTGYIFMAGQHSGEYIFNNVIQSISGCPEALVRINDSGASNVNTVFDNNTLIGHCSAVDTDALTNLVAENNIFSNVDTAWYQRPNNTTALGAVDHNDFYNVTNIASVNNGPGPPTTYVTLANWQAATIAGGAHPDMNSSTGNPLLGPSYAPQPTSGVNCTGANLYGLTPNLNFDKAGNARPNNSTVMCANGSNNWTMGAMQSSGSAPAAPSGLSAVVQ
jgi:hypothetical protein